MPSLDITVRLIRITRKLEPGQWLMIFEDDSYDILDHPQALILQGLPARKPRSDRGKLHAKREAKSNA